MREVLVTRVDARRLAFPVTHVVELQRAVAEQPLAGAPAVVAGVVNLRGRVVAVVDARVRLGLSPRDATPSDHLCFLDTGERVVAVRVEGVEELVTLSYGAATPAVTVAPDLGVGRQVAAVHDGVLVIEDVATFLSGEELLGLDAALAALDEVAP